MITSSSILVLAALVQVLFAQQPDFQPGPPGPPGPHHKGPPPGAFPPGIPKSCWVPPREVNLFKCCPIPPLYSDEVMQSCGFEKPSEDGPKQPKRHRRPDGTCKEGYCVMGNADLLQTNNSVDYEKFRSYLDNWAASNPDFAEAIQIAKEDCAQDGGPAGPPVCEPDRLFFCLTSKIFWNCKLRDEDGCQALQQHMDECRQYYTKPKEQIEGNAERR
ncbi:hypothetical protein HW555_010718 [Spodoptera exigua]|uniref:Uncharacterized protein n=1 Tax=Spodoptera exigua TaxID=7107 RepID=A0A835L0N3_SPOEX|nr:hypothetical protein HW555_010718 [Spodoptera exigua]